MPARLLGVKEDTGAKIEVLLLKQEEDDKWETLVKPAKRVKVGTVISFGDGKLKATCIGRADQGGRQLEFSYDGIFNEVLDELGEMPLPPYIKEKARRSRSISNGLCERNGSAAAPTAGLHFTEELLEEIEAKRRSYCIHYTHVGLGTFRPVSVDRIEEHEMHAEYYQMSEETAAILNQVKEEWRANYYCRNNINSNIRNDCD